VSYTTVVAGTTITAAWGNANVRDQVVTPFASSAARASAITAPVEGMVSHLNDANTLGVYSGAAWSSIGPVHGLWTAYSPAWTANGGSAPVIGNGTLDGFYQRIGRTVHFMARMVAGSTTTFGSGSSPWRFTVPVAAGGSTWEQLIGATYLDVSGSTYLPATTDGIIDTSSTFVEYKVLNATTMAWAVGDKVLINGTYQCGSDA
jgi:hypothetical protein